MFKNSFKTKEEAEAYKIKHELYVMKAEYISCSKKWSLIYDVKTIQQQEEEIQ